MVIGVDIGGTHFRMSLVSKDGDMIAHERLDTKSIKDPLAALTQMRDRVDPNREASNVVAGVPGVVDYSKGALVFAPHLDQSWIPQLTQEEIGAALDLNAAVVNDADLAAIGESYLGAGRTFDAVGYVTVSTGVGAGVVIGGRLLKARLSLAELGHCIIPEVGESSLGVGFGAVEDLASGTALSSRARESGLGADNKTLVTLAQRAADVKNFDALEFRLLDTVAQDLAVALANLCWITSIDHLVVGGGLAIGSPLLLELTRGYLEKYRPRYLEFELVPALLGDDAALRGSAFAIAALR